MKNLLIHETKGYAFATLHREEGGACIDTAACVLERKTPVLRTAALPEIDRSKQPQAREHRICDSRRRCGQRREVTVEARADGQRRAVWVEMQVRCVCRNGLLEIPVEQAHRRGHCDGLACSTGGRPGGTAVRSL